MGGTTSVERLVSRSRAISVVAALTLAVLGLSCSSDGSGGTPPREVDASAAYIAIVEWQAAEQEPVVNDDGTERSPIIYVVAADGGTIDVGVQATVAATAVDLADVRFADEAAEAFVSGEDGGAVIDSGVMLLVGAIPDAAPKIDVNVLRYLSVDSSSLFQLQITADDQTTSSGIGTATVTSVTQP